jgi:hypothetical protein
MCKSKMIFEIRMALIAGSVLGFLLGWNRYPLPLAVIGEVMFPPANGLRESFTSSTVAIFFGLIAGSFLLFLSKEKVATIKLWEKGLHLTVVTTFLISLTIFHVLGENICLYGMTLRALHDPDVYVAIWPVPILVSTLRFMMAKCLNA